MPNVQQAATVLEQVADRHEFLDGDTVEVRDHGGTSAVLEFETESGVNANVTVAVEDDDFRVDGHAWQDDEETATREFVHVGPESAVGVDVLRETVPEMVADVRELDEGDLVRLAALDE